LEDAGEKGGLAPFGFAAEGDEAGHILVFGAETVDHPGAEGGFGELEGTGVHEALSDIVSWDIGPERAKDGHIVDELAEFGED